MQPGLERELFTSGEVELDQKIKTIGSWSFSENLLYIVFLQKNKVVMQSKKKRRYSSFNLEMRKYSTKWRALWARGSLCSAGLTIRSF